MLSIEMFTEMNCILVNKQEPFVFSYFSRRGTRDAIGDSKQRRCCKSLFSYSSLANFTRMCISEVTYQCEKKRKKIVKPQRWFAGKSARASYSKLFSLLRILFRSLPIHQKGKRKKGFFFFSKVARNCCDCPQWRQPNMSRDILLPPHPHTLILIWREVPIWRRDIYGIRTHEIQLTRSNSRRPTPNAAKESSPNANSRNPFGTCFAQIGNQHNIHAYRLPVFSNQK